MNHMGDQEFWAPGFWSDTVLAIVNISELNQQKEDLSHSINYPFQTKY